MAEAEQIPPQTEPTEVMNMDSTSVMAVAPANAPVGLEPVSWTASEFIAHEKTVGWYGMLALATGVVGGLIFLVTRDFISTSMVIFGAILFGIYANRQPRQLPYRLDQRGLHIGQRYYDLGQFRSFSVVQEGAFASIILMPLRRFAPLTPIYYAPEAEDKIVDILASQLPYAEYRHDVVERLMRQIRF